MKKILFFVLFMPQIVGCMQRLAAGLYVTTSLGIPVYVCASKSTKQGALKQEKIIPGISWAD